MRGQQSIDIPLKDGLAAEGARTPRHRQIYEFLLGEIASGRFQPGDRLPTETELAKTFAASPSTIARALRDLKSRGLLDRQRGSGTHIARQEGKRIALFMPFTQSAADLGYIGGQIHRHLSELAAQRGDHLRLQLISRTAGGDTLEQMLSATQALIKQGVGGVFYYPVELSRDEAHYNTLCVERLQAAGMAVVCVDRDTVAFPDRSTLPLVTYDNRRGGYLVADHLIHQGCRRIAFIGSPYASSAAGDRLRGYHDALEDHFGHVDRTMARTASFENLDAAFCRSLVDDLKPDAIVCKMDHYAAVVGRHLVDMGITIGRDIRMAGFDDEPFGALLPVPLTTIRFPADPFAAACYERMEAQLADPRSPLPGMMLVNVELVIRESTFATADTHLVGARSVRRHSTTSSSQVA